MRQNVQRWMVLTNLCLLLAALSLAVVVLAKGAQAGERAGALGARDTLQKLTDTTALQQKLLQAHDAAFVAEQELMRARLITLAGSLVLLAGASLNLVLIRRSRPSPTQAIPSPSEARLGDR